MTRPPITGVVLLTGASSGIGEAMARQLSEARVLILVARRRERLEALAESLPNAEVRACDLLDLRACEQLIAGVEADHGGVDVLINNAGMGDIGLFDQADGDKLIRMIDLNVRSLTWLTRRVLPRMVEQGRGGILNISSGFGLTWMPVASAYVATKHYVSALSESLRTELQGTGVVVTQSCPGPVATEFEDKAGNPTGMQVPGLIQISAETCARQSLSAFRSGRALTIPGFVAWLAISAGRLSPSWVLRLIYWPLGGLLR
jgi:short-subunit dehydrogenase